MWVRALLMRCSAGGAAAFVVRRGDDERGARFVKVSTLDGKARLYGPAPAGLSDMGGGDALVAHLDEGGVGEREVDAYIARQIEYDPDIWVIEIEDRQGRSFLGD